MTFETVRDVMNQNKPFTLKKQDGESIDVQHPDYVLLAERPGVLTIVDPEKRLHLVPLSAISDITIS